MARHIPTGAFQQTLCISFKIICMYICTDMRAIRPAQRTVPFIRSRSPRLCSRDIHYTLFSLSLEDSGGARDFSHSSKKLLAVRLMLLGDRRLTTLGRISSSLGERIGAALMVALPFLFESVSVRTMVNERAARCLPCLLGFLFRFGD
jgi:hypothetical protein